MFKRPNFPKCLVSYFVSTSGLCFGSSLKINGYSRLSCIFIAGTLLRFEPSRRIKYWYWAVRIYKNWSRKQNVLSLQRSERNILVSSSEINTVDKIFFVRFIREMGSTEQDGWIILFIPKAIQISGLNQFCAFNGMSTIFTTTNVMTQSYFHNNTPFIFAASLPMGPWSQEVFGRCEKSTQTMCQLMRPKWNRSHSRNHSCYVQCACPLMMLLCITNY